MKEFRDIADLPEDERITQIAEACGTDQLVGFFVDDDAKADRYIEKLKRYPVRVIDRRPFPLKSTTVVLVRVRGLGH